MKNKIYLLLSVFLASSLLPTHAWAKKKIWRVTPQNIDQIEKWAAEGNGYYMAVLGQVFRYGELGKKDSERAASLFSQSAKKKNPIGMYEHGRRLIWTKKDVSGGKKLLKKSIKGLKKLAKKGNPRAHQLLGLAYRTGEGVVGVEMASCFNHYLMAAQEGYREAHWDMGFWIYENGRCIKGKKKYLVAAAKEYKKCANLGHEKCMTQLASLFFEGKGGVPKDISQGIKWSLKADNRSTVWGKYDLYGILKKDDTLQFITYLEKKANDGDATAMNQLGKIYSEKKCGVGIDCEKALKWHRLAAENGNSNSIHDLGVMYTLGKTKYSKSKCVEKNPVRALKWFKATKSKNKGTDQQIENLDRYHGLNLFMDIKGQGMANDQSDIDALLTTMDRAYGAGLPEMADEAFKEALKKIAVSLYFDDTWFTLQQKGRSHSLSSEILLAVKAEKENEAGFWLDYAHNANIAGQPGLAILGAQKLAKLAKSESPERARKIFALSTVIQAAAHRQMGNAKAANKILFLHGQLKGDKTEVANYISHWAKPLLEDKTKLSLLTGIPKSAFTGFKATYKQHAFHDIETGKLIVPTAAPKLKNSSSVRKERKVAPRKKAAPVVEILE